MAISAESGYHQPRRRREMFTSKEYKCHGCGRYGLGSLFIKNKHEEEQGKDPYVCCPNCGAGPDSIKAESVIYPTIGEYLRTFISENTRREKTKTQTLY